MLRIFKKNQKDCRLFLGSSTILRATNGWQQLFHIQKRPGAHIDAYILELIMLSTLENFFNWVELSYKGKEAIPDDAHVPKH